MGVGGLGLQKPFKMLEISGSGLLFHRLQCLKPSVLLLLGDFELRWHWIKIMPRKGEQWEEASMTGSMPWISTVRQWDSWGSCTTHHFTELEKRVRGACTYRGKAS